MPSPIVIKIKCDLYLVRFLEKLYGPSPISFPAQSNFNMFLDVFLSQPPLNYLEQDHGENTLLVQLPYFENKNVLSYYFLTQKAQQKFVDEIWKFFKITYRSEISKYIMVGLYRKDSIEMFIDKYNLPMDCWDMLEKDYQRYIQLSWKRRLFKKNLNLSSKGAVCLVGKSM